jgi:hypothetical protein
MTSHPWSKVFGYSVGGALTLSVLDVCLREVCLQMVLPGYDVRLWRQIRNWKSYVNGGLCIGFLIGLYKAQRDCKICEC